MANTPYGREQQEPTKRNHGEPCKCEEGETPTQKSLPVLRLIYCQAKDSAKSAKEVASTDFEAKKELFEEKKKTFMWTERNYRLFRDLDIIVDTRLQATNDTFKTNVASYNAQSAALYGQLKGILTAVKDVKAKVSALWDQASNLDKYKNDQCNASQWALLTGKNMEGCKPDPNTPMPERPEHCKDADKIYNDLIHVTKKVLSVDVASLLNASADIVGIQTFSNIAALTAQQTNLATASTNFKTAINAVSKTRAADLATLQTDLTTTLTDATVAGINRFTAVSDFDAACYTLDFLCHKQCECVEPRKEGDCHPRLHDCECEICEICKEVKNTYCNEQIKPVIA